MFRRPKKPIRPRVITTEPEIEEDEDDEVQVKEIKTPSVPHKEIDLEISSRRPAASLLSFDDEFQDDEDVFRVKKSSTSRKLMKKRDKEKKEPKQSIINDGIKIKEEKQFVDHPPPSVDGIDRNNIVNANSLTASVKKDQDFVRILNGREAEAVDMESGSEDEEDGKNPKFSRTRTSRGKDFSDTLRRTLEQDQIPDANLVHEVRKRRQMARSIGGPGAPAYIPVNETERYRMQKSRLVREDDENDHSEDEDDDRLDFSIVGNAASIDREKRKEVFEAAQEQEVKSDDDSEAEMDEWESQQLRKGVSKTQMNNVAFEVRQQNDFLTERDAFQPTNGSFNSQFMSANMQEVEAEADLAGSSMGYSELPEEVSIENIVNGVHIMSPEQILEKLNKRLEVLNLSQEESEREVSGLTADLEIVNSEINETRTAVPILTMKFTLYQKLRGYVTDLVDCLRCKMPIIQSLEKRMSDLMQTRLDHLVERRRQDVRDQLEEINIMLNALNSGSGVPAPHLTINDARTRRAAEREGRRTRRRKLREMKGLSQNHKDGLSSDDEETELEIATFKAQKEIIIRDSQLVFDDVNPEFASLEEVLIRFKEWREMDISSYQESYTHMCIPKLISPFVRLGVLGWDPLAEDSDLIDCDWIKPLIAYGFVKDETMQALGLDPDSRTIPNLIEKYLITRIEGVVKAMWDPTSVRQTRKLVNLVKKLINEWSVGPNGKAMHGLMCTVVSKFKNSLDHDVFIPIFPKSAMNKSAPASVYSSRQFWSSIKVLDNISAWTGLLGDKPLQILALDALLTRYILLGLRTAVDLNDSAEKADGVVKVLPRLWLTPDSDGEFPSGIQQLIRCLVFIVQSSDCTLASNRLAVPEIAKILKSIGALAESQIILSKYS